MWEKIKGKIKRFEKVLFCAIVLSLVSAGIMLTVLFTSYQTRERLQNVRQELEEVVSVNMKSYLTEYIPSYVVGTIEQGTTQKEEAAAFSEEQTAAVIAGVTGVVQEEITEQVLAGQKILTETEIDKLENRIMELVKQEIAGMELALSEQEIVTGEEYFTEEELEVIAIGAASIVEAELADSLKKIGDNTNGLHSLWIKNDNLQGEFAALRSSSEEQRQYMAQQFEAVGMDYEALWEELEQESARIQELELVDGENRLLELEQMDGENRLLKLEQMDGENQNRLLKLESAMEQLSGLQEEVEQMKQSFQGGCDVIVAACTARESVPTDNSPQAIAEAIMQIDSGRDAVTRTVTGGFGNTSSKSHGPWSAYPSADGQQYMTIQCTLSNDDSTGDCRCYLSVRGTKDGVEKVLFSKSGARLARGSCTLADGTEMIDIYGYDSVVISASSDGNNYCSGRYTIFY